MRLWIFSSVVTLAAFMSLVTLTSVVIAWMVPSITRRLERYGAATRASVLFRVRMLPAALSAIVVFGVLLPAYLRYEPRESDESLGAAMILLACGGAGLILRGAWRAHRAWRATKSLMQDWTARARPIQLLDGPVRVFAIDEAFPTVAVVGVTRPALFIAERVLEACPPAEVRAMLEHEYAHVRGGDNLKRLLIRACPDVVSARLDRAWMRAAEEAADAAVVAANPSSAIDLAQALIRVARLAPAGQTLSVASAFFAGGSIESRVRRLVQSDASREASFVLYRALLTCGAAAAAFASIALGPSIYRGIEAATRFLP